MIASFEGLRTDAYYDVVGVPTICYGSTTNVFIGMKKTKQECWELLKEEVEVFQTGLEKSLPYTVWLSQKEMDAYTSFAYNVGLGNWRMSTLLKKLKRGDRIGACGELKKWIYAKGKIFEGLRFRRSVEEAICLQGARGEEHLSNGFWSDYYSLPVARSYMGQE